MELKDLNEYLLALIIIALVVFLLCAIYKFGMSRKSFEEILEEQKQYEIALLGKPKQEKKKEKKKQPVPVTKKKPAEKTETHAEKVHQVEEPIIQEKNKEVKVGQVSVEATKVTKRKVGKEHQVDNKIKELTSVEKTDKIKEKNVSNEIKSGKVEHVTFGPATTKKQPINSGSGKEHGIIKSVAAAATEAPTQRPSSKSPVAQKPTRSTDAGPVNVDSTKKKKNKDAEIHSGESEKIVAAAAPITKSAPSTGSHADNAAVRVNESKKNKGPEVKLEANNIQKSSAAPLESATAVKITSTGPSSPAAAAAAAAAATANSEWSTKSQKGDPSVALRKSLEEKDGEVRMLQAQLQAANIRYNESRQELLDNNQKFSAHDKALKQQLSAKEQECAELRKRVGSGAGVGGASNDGQVQVIMHLSEENRQLKETIGKLQQQVTQAAAVAAASQQQQGGSADLKQQLKFMDEALKQNSKLLNNSENNRKTVEAKLKQIEEELNKSNLRAKDLEMKYRTAEDRLVKSENAKKSAVSEEDVKVYQAKLKEKELRTSELEEQMKHLEAKFGQLQQRLQDQDSEILSLRAKNGPSVNFNGTGNGFLENNLSNGLSEEYNQLAEQLAAANKTVQQLEHNNKEKTEELKKALEELNVVQMTHDRDFSLQLEKFSSISSELDRTKEDLKLLQSASEEKSKELQNLSERLSQSTSSEDDIAAKERQLNENLQELDRCKETISSLQAELSDRTKELEKLSQKSNENALIEHSNDNSEEIEKHKATIDQLEAESSRKSEELQHVKDELELLRVSSDNGAKLAELSKEVEQFQEDVDRLKKVNDEKTAEMKNLLNELNNMKQANKELSERLQKAENLKPEPTNSVQENGFEGELQEAKESESKLQTEVQHYKTVLHDTERILRQLQDNVELEEQNWQGKLSAAQHQLHEYAEKVQELEQRLEESHIEKLHLQHRLKEGLINGTSSPSIDHKEEKIRKADRAIVYPAELQATS